MDVDVDLWRRRIREETFSHYHYEMARAIEREGDIAAAEAAYRRALDIRPDYPEAYHHLIALLTAAGQTAAAAAADAAIKAINPHYVAWAWHSFALDAYAEDRLDDAVRFLDKARALHPDLAVDPELSNVYFRLATEAERLGRSAAAIGLLEKALALNPNDFRFWWLLGVSYLTACSFVRADRVLCGALAFQPDDPMILTALALARQKSASSDAAARLHRRALAVAPKSTTALCNMAFFHQGEGDPTAASVYVEQAFALNARDPNVWTHRGIVAVMQGRFDAAETALRRALTLLPDYGFAESNLALALSGLGREEEASDMHRRSIPHLGARRKLFTAFRPWAAERLNAAYARLGLSDDDSAC